MKKFIMALMALAMVAVGSQSASAGNQKAKKADKDTENFRYDVEYAQTGGNNMTVVKVWSYSKRPSIAIEQSRKNAVHAVMFKGYTGGQGTISQRALIQNQGVLSEKSEFFDSFFAPGGQYMKYVSGSAGDTEVRKIGKEYKIGVVVTVNKDQLRKDLEDAGIIKGLGAGF